MKSFYKSLKRQDGFTLVELMVVVAIIGLLSAVAIPNFKKYQAKAKSAEAKLQLAAIYTAEQAFFSDYNIFHSCLKYMGYNPVVERASRYYTTGFGTITAITGAPLTNAEQSGLVVGAGACNSGANESSFLAEKRVVGNVVPAPLSEFPATVTNGSQADSDNLIFTAGAAGFISADTVTAGASSLFTIDHTKNLRNVRPGY
jgi:type IV pilus assembly protein PilA